MELERVNFNKAYRLYLSTMKNEKSTGEITSLVEVGPETEMPESNLIWGFGILNVLAVVAYRYVNKNKKEPVTFEFDMESLPRKE